MPQQVHGMLELKDFYHLPEVEELIDRVAGDGPGLTVVAGLGPRPASQAAEAAQTGSARLAAGAGSGRAAVFGILARRLLARLPRGRASLVAASRDALRLPDALRRRVEGTLRRQPLPVAEQMAEAVRKRPDILIVDELTPETAAPAAQAAAAGARVLAQVDCVFTGAGVAKHLLDLGLGEDGLAQITWIVSVQRHPALCPECRLPATLDAVRLDDLRRRFPGVALAGSFYRAPTPEMRNPACPTCGGAGRHGEVMAFDFFRARSRLPELFDQPSLLALNEYILRLAVEGHVDVETLVDLEQEQLRRIFGLLTASERALGDANRELQARVAELQAANRVLTQRTESLVSLQELAQVLIGQGGLPELARRISRHMRDLCGADRSALYVLRPDMTAGLLAVTGWEPPATEAPLDALKVFGSSASGATAGPDPAHPGPSPFEGPPPGISARHPDLEGAEVRAGLRVPLVAQHEVVGLLIVHSTRKARFAPGEVAQVQAYADYAALAIQREGLIESLRDKIARLEAAQADLVRKERLDHELDLARQVQQGLLPRAFPAYPGCDFAAQNRPARQVGGDFYDVFDLGDGLCGIAIADVSDKGMPAALFMALTRSLLLAEARRERSPQRVLESVHRLLLELGDPQMFVTLFYAVLDTRSLQLRYTRAGHERPLLLRDGSAEPLGGRGTFLGYLAADDLGLSEESLALRPGDRLVLYTDGLVDALSPTGEPFGDERLAAFLATQAHLPPAALCSAVFDAIAAHQGDAEQFDDMAVVVTGVNDTTH